MAKISCNCNNGGDAVKFQIKTYGENVRIGTPKLKKTNLENQKYSCTICGKITDKEIK